MAFIAANGLICGRYGDGNGENGNNGGINGGNSPPGINSFIFKLFLTKGSFGNLFERKVVTYASLDSV